MATDAVSGATAVAPSFFDEDSYETVDGQRVELPPMSVQEIRLANLLARYLWWALGEHPTGEVFVEMLFRLRREPVLDRKPDVAYVPYGKWPDRIVPVAEAWEMIPALAVEVVSKSNTVWETQQKVEDYFRSGVNLLWVIHPKQRSVHVYTSPKNIKALDGNDTLDGGTVLPSFRLSVRELFATLPPQTGA